MLIDTHAHLFWESFEADFDDVIRRSIDAGVTGVVNIGVDVALSKAAIELVAKLKKFPEISAYATIAIHPEESIKYIGKNNDLRLMINKDIEQLETLYLENKDAVIGIGECGLDYSYSIRENYLPSNVTISTMKQLQKDLFQAQIDLAKKHNLPLFIHVRDDRSQNPDNSECWDDAINMSKDHFGIYHCYSGLSQTTNYILQTTNFFISFAGNITYPKNEYLREAVKTTPLERMVMETDCPFLAPQSKRGQRNEPSSVREIAEFIADLKRVTFEEVARQTSDNFIRLIRKPI